MYSMAYLAGIGAKRLKLSAAEVEVPKTDDDYGDFLNGMRHVFPIPDSWNDMLIHCHGILNSANRVRDAIRNSIEEGELS